MIATNGGGDDFAGGGIEGESKEGEEREFCFKNVKSMPLLKVVNSET